MKALDPSLREFFAASKRMLETDATSTAAALRSCAPPRSAIYPWLTAVDRHALIAGYLPHSERRARELDPRLWPSLVGRFLADGASADWSALRLTAHFVDALPPAGAPSWLSQLAQFELDVAETFQCQDPAQFGRTVRVRLYPNDVVALTKVGLPLTDALARPKAVILFRSERGGLCHWVEATPALLAALGSYFAEARVDAALSSQVPAEDVAKARQRLLDLGVVKERPIGGTPW